MTRYLDAWTAVRRHEGLLLLTAGRSGRIRKWSELDFLGLLSDGDDFISVITIEGGQVELASLVA
jgi:hypothetical protein